MRRFEYSRADAPEQAAMSASPKDASLSRAAPTY